MAPKSSRQITAIRLMPRFCWVLPSTNVSAVGAAINATMTKVNTKAIIKRSAILGTQARDSGAACKEPPHFRPTPITDKPKGRFTLCNSLASRERTFVSQRLMIGGRTIKSDLASLIDLAGHFLAMRTTASIGKSKVFA